MKNLEQRITEQYGDGYDISLIKIDEKTDKLTVTCPDHGEFEASADNFVYMAGCKQCRGKHNRGYPDRRNKHVKQKTGPKPKHVEPCTLYVVKIDKYMKVFVTENKDVLKEVDALNSDSFRGNKHELLFMRKFNRLSLCNAVYRAINQSFKRDIAPFAILGQDFKHTIDIDHLTTLIGIINSFPDNQI